MHRFGLVAAALLIGGILRGPATATAAQQSTQTAPAATPAALLDAAIDRMGGAEALRGIRTIRLEMMTQWQSIGFNERPYVDRISYERHTPGMRPPKSGCSPRPPVMSWNLMTAAARKASA
jgi:hypothetical protein